APFSKIDRYTLPQRNDVRSVSLEDIAVDLRSGLVRRVPLQRVCSLTKLQIETCAPPPSSIEIGCMFENHAGLVQTELIAEDVVGTKEVHTANWVVEVVGIICVDPQIDGRVPQEIQRLPVFALSEVLLLWNNLRLRRSPKSALAYRPAGARL